jgi:hypothetical protein
MKSQAQENTGRVIAVTLLLWALAVAAATAEGVFAKLPASEFAVLAAFTALYAPAMYRIDQGIREFVLAFSLRRIAVAAAALDIVLAAAFAASIPSPLFAFFGVPLAIVAHFALAERALLQARVRSAAATPPGGRQAAT